MKIGFILSFLLLPIFLQAQTSQELAQDGLAAYDQGEYEQAVFFFSQAINQDDDFAVLYHMRAVCNLELAKHEACLTDLNKAILLDPGFMDAYMFRAYLLLEYLKREDEAILDYNFLIEHTKDPEVLYTCYLNRASAKQITRDFEGALEDVTVIYQQDTSDMDVRVSMATILDDLGEVDRALQMLRDVAEEHPGQLPVLINIGFQLSRIDQCEEAIYWLEKAMELDKEEALTWNNLGYAKYCIGDNEGAESDVKRSLELDPENSYAWRNLALIHLANEDQEEACAAIEKALEFNFTFYFGPEVAELKALHCH